MSDKLISNQTLQEFISSPFGFRNEMKNLKYEGKYQAYKRSNKIVVESTIEFEKNYFVHVKVPSESQKGQSYYDVVIQFFTPDPDIERELSVEHYYVQFFSNSPGFVYKYAALYKINGYLIEALYDKIGKESLDTLPTKSNSSYEMYFDSSIYYASRFILDNKMSILGKLNIKIYKTKPVNQFFGDIQDFESVNLIRDVNTLTANIKKEIKADTDLSKKTYQQRKIQKNSLYGKFGRKEPIKAKKNTFKDGSPSSFEKKHKITKTGKKRPTKSTTKR